MAINGVPQGGSGLFQESPSPAGSTLQSGAPIVFKTSDPLVLSGPSSDADPSKVVLSVPNPYAPASFSLSVSGVNSAGSAISSSFVIPVLPPIPPPAQGFSLEQLS